MGAFRKTYMLASRGVNGALDHLLTRKPEVILEESIRRQGIEIRKAQTGLYELLAAKKRCEIQSERLEQQIQSLEEAAEEHVLSGDEDQAERVLTRAYSLRQQQREINTRLEGFQTAIETTSGQVKRALEAHETNRMTVAGDLAAYRANKGLVGAGESLAQLGGGDDVREMEARAREEMEMTEAKARALTSPEMAELPLGGSAARRIGDPLLELPSGAVKRYLREIKDRVGSAQLPEGDTGKQAIEAGESTGTEPAPKPAAEFDGLGGS